MSKRALMVSTVPSTIGQFNRDNIHILQELGYEVDIAADFTDTSIWPAEKTEKLKRDMEGAGVQCFQLNFSRNPLKLPRHIASYKETVRLIRERGYSLIHTHTPIASAVVRMAARKTGTKVIYTAHGFHFYKGAPLLNWIIYYPVEKTLSRYTDVLITIAQEDFERAKKRMHARKTVYVPGVGVDCAAFSRDENGRRRVRNELGLAEDRILLLSVGELNENKNHLRVIEAIAGLPVTYAIAGKGVLEQALAEAGKDIDLRLLGYRNDVRDLYSAADVYILPSLREGLNVSLMEAMACGLPAACGRIRGNTDLVEKPLFDPHNTAEIRAAVEDAIAHRGEYGLRNLEKIADFDKKQVREAMTEIYRSVQEVATR